MTKGIFEGFSAYYKQYGGTNVASAKPQKSNAQAATATTVATTKSKQSNSAAAPMFKIQILASDKKLAANDKRLKGLKVDYYKEKGLYKYTYGASENYNEINALRKKIASKFKEAFIVAFRNGKKIDTQEAIREFKQKK